MGDAVAAGVPVSLGEGGGVGDALVVAEGLPVALGGGDVAGGVPDCEPVADALAVALRGAVALGVAVGEGAADRDRDGAV